MENEEKGYNQNEEEYQLIDANDGKVTKLLNKTKQQVNGIVDKIGSIPSFAKDILNSFDKSEENYDKLANQDKETIQLIIKQKLESGNYTDEELHKLLDRAEKITEDSGGFKEKIIAHRRELLLIVSGAMVATLKIMLENRNKA
ncbi:hypothetical protein [Metabacillus sp. B2-18]|uniref:hypothetical protein n=1 Tax=Metabacillus sp. B2-18 TaxID=2897333 RepID=UPI001E3D3DDF|nr:hypothetical protein [Metabacillus sp. B2-18]UGB29957.1 hypothetical protein LPC09_19895 [Metabacillus sp. B2-18]